MRSFSPTAALCGAALLALSGCGSFSTDLDALCKHTEAVNADQPDADASTQLAAIVQRWEPGSDKGKQLDGIFSGAEPERVQELVEHAATQANLSDWSCPALDAFTEKAKEEAAVKKHAAMCASLDAELDALAYSLLDPLREEIPKITKELVPADKQAAVTKTFTQEVEVRVDQSKKPDEILDKKKAQVRQILGCPDGEPAEDACAQLQRVLPSLTNNRRVISLGEAYGVALATAGLNPQDYVVTLQQRIQKISATRVEQTVQPHIDKLAAATGCDFK